MSLAPDVRESLKQPRISISISITLAWVAPNQLARIAHNGDLHQTLTNSDAAKGDKRWGKAWERHDYVRRRACVALGTCIPFEDLYPPCLRNVALNGSLQSAQYVKCGHPLLDPSFVMNYDSFSTWN